MVQICHVTQPEFMNLFPVIGISPRLKTKRPEPANRKQFDFSTINVYNFLDSLGGKECLGMLKILQIV